MRLPIVEVVVECLGVLLIGTSVGAWPMAQSPLLLIPRLIPLLVATAQPPQIIKYETEQGVNGYSFSYTMKIWLYTAMHTYEYELTDGTVRREEGRLEDGIWIVFWGAEWMDDSRTIVKIVSDRTGVSWSIYRAPAVGPIDFVPMQPPTTHRPQAASGVPSPVEPGFEIDLKKDQEPFFIQGCKDVYDKNKKIKGISCLAKASLAGGSPLNYLRARALLQKT